MRFVYSIIDTIETFFYRIAQIIVLVMMLFSALDTILRYFVGSPIRGGYEIIAEYMMPYLVYLSVSYVFKTGGHVRVTLLTQYVSGKLQRILMLLVNILSIVLFSVLTYATFLKAFDAYEIGERSINVLAYPLWPAFGIATVGCAMLTIRLIVTVVKRENPYAGHEHEID